MLLAPSISGLFLFRPRCNVLSAKPWLLQNPTCRSPLASNSVTSAFFSRKSQGIRTTGEELNRANQILIELLEEYGYRRSPGDAKLPRR